MEKTVKIIEKYERNGWPSIKRPDLKPPPGWSLELVVGLHRIRHQNLSPNGRSIAFIWDRDDLSDVYVMPAAGGWPQRISMDRTAVAFWDDELPQWSADGKQIAYSNDGHVYVAPVAGGLPKKITDFTTAASMAYWMPDNHHILVYVDRDDEHVQLLLTDIEGNWPRSVVALPGDARDVRPSPDGNSVVVVFRPEDDPNRWDLRLVDLRSGEARLLTGAPKQKDWCPRWSPDGKTIAFISQRGGWDQVWLIGTDGSGLRQLTTQSNDFTDLDWSPDNQKLACTINRDGMFDLCLIDVASGQLADLVLGGGYFCRPSWSSDGSFLTVEYENPIKPPDIYRVAVPGGEMTQLTFSNPPALASKQLVMPELVTYPSINGLQISALLYKPPKPNGAGIVHPHGGPSAQNIYEFFLLAQYFVAKGFTFIAPNYRGSTGYGVAFEQSNYNDWGGADMQDVLNAARYLHTLKWIDPGRLAVFGGSQGGYLTNLCLARDPDYLFACGISVYGDAHIESSWALCKRDLRVYTEMMMGKPGLNRDLYIKGSPLFQVENIKRPLLILHGLEDDVVPPEASEILVEALRHAGKIFEYKTYAGEPHGFLKRKTLLDAYQRIERFLDWYLMPPAPSDFALATPKQTKPE
jgi:dipeptidyl aminopeptidase/acylaminoacyl peptidase